MAVAKNSKKNVSAAKGVAGGYFYFASAGTTGATAPTDYTSEIPDAFSNLGYANDEGVTSTPSYSSTDHTDMNGEVVDTSQDGYSLKLEVTLTEYKAATLKVEYGAANVTDENGKLTVVNKGVEGERGILVLELVLKNGRKLRRVYPDAKCVELGEETMVAKEVFARKATFAIYKDDESGAYNFDYAESTETSA